MEYGAILPQHERGTDPARYREFARRAEELGYDHLLAYDHVVGPSPDRPDWEGIYTNEVPLHEPLTLFTHLAAVTETIDLVTGILILPQRQTALTAKQAAEVDLLSEGRLRLGIGVGWNELEYVALGEAFSERGRRVEEQVEVLRKLWTEPMVDYDGEFHDIPAVGINPRPVQQPIPLWMGGGADVVLRRIARTGDGWALPGDPFPELETKLDRLAGYLEDEGRSLDDLALLGRMGFEGDDPEAWVKTARKWADLGATHVALDVRGADDPTERLATVADAFDDAGLSLG
jgi:probable F420-dependent oxidoreductase